MRSDPHRISKFRLLARLGSGGMAEVFLVLAEGPGGFDKLQVVKLLRSDLSEHERPDFLRMFEDEVRLAARLNHPNIVQAHEVGSDGGQPFIVMEFLEGQPLSRVHRRSVQSGGSFTLEMKLFVLCQVLDALSYAHDLTDYDGSPLGMVHRDISPQNIFIAYAGQTKLVDFGVAKTLGSNKTQAGVVKGKVAYMAPEQAVGAPIDRRSDLFSVGVLLWEAIADRSMHADTSVYESLRRLVRGELPSIRDVNPDVPVELERILERALALEPDARYQTADAFRHDLLAYLDSISRVSARSVGECVAQLFARERAELQAVIRRATAQPDGPDLSPGSFHANRALPDFGSSAAQLAPDVKGTPLPASPRRSASSAPARKSLASTARRQVALIAALALALVGGVAATIAMQRPEAPRAAIAPPPSPEVPVVAPTIELRVLAKPDHAKILLDGRPVEGNPYAASHARDEREHTLRVAAAGFRAEETRLRFDRDVALQVHLAELERASVGSSSGPKPPRKSGAARERPARPRARRRDDAAFVDLPEPPRPAPGTVPQLDTDDPWRTKRDKDRSRAR